MTRSFRSSLSALDSRLHRARRRAFTLIELLTVVAIIGILAAIIIPTVGSVRTSANKARVRSQFGQWTTAFESFRQEYGVYPQFSTTGAQKLVNQVATATAAGDHLFHDSMAGVHRDGSRLTNATGTNPPAALAQNTRRIRFLNFTDADLVTPADVTAGFNTAAQQYYIRDAFHNTSIAVITDTNLDGVINSTDSGGAYPAVTVYGGTTTIRPTTIVTTTTTGGTHAGVIFYVAPPGATTENDLITSWK